LASGETAVCTKPVPILMDSRYAKGARPVLQRAWISMGTPLHSLLSPGGAFWYARESGCLLHLPHVWHQCHLSPLFTTLPPRSVLSLRGQPPHHGLRLPLAHKAKPSTARSIEKAILINRFNPISSTSPELISPSQAQGLVSADFPGPTNHDPQWWILPSTPLRPPLPNPAIPPGYSRPPG
jgi:hypothetical protein